MLEERKNKYNAKMGSIRRNIYSGVIKTEMKRPSHISIQKGFKEKT
jgi:hypothetical protein